ncbi:MAG: insulinase family protein [Magnetococcales bacterium]|nr:insulinase family protein [Magnetococcales bacterium]
MNGSRLFRSGLIWSLGLWCLVWASMGLAGEQDKVRHFVTANGIQVYLVENTAIPMVEIRILTRGGGAHDPADRSGVAALTAWMFNEGGGELDSVAFQERLHYYGISMGASAGPDALEVSMTTLSEHLDEAWSRLGDAMLRPRFAPEDFQRGVRERLAELIKSEEEPTVQATRAIHPLIYGDHPYARPVNGTVESVKRIELADIRRHHGGAFRGAGLVIAVAGDVGLERLKGLVEKHLSGLDPLPGPFDWPAEASAPEEATGRETHVEMDLPQTTVRIGGIGIHRHDPDFYALTVMNQILGGGGLTSRLTRVIREERGLAYGVFSYFSPLSGRGPFMVGTETKTESLDEALALIRGELTRLAEEELDENELKDVQRYLTGSFPLQLDGLDKLADSWCRIGFYNRGLDYLDRWPERIRAVTREDVRRVAKRMLPLKKLHTVTVGKRRNADAKDGGSRPETAASPPSR